MTPSVAHRQRMHTHPSYRVKLLMIMISFQISLFLPCNLLISFMIIDFLKTSMLSNMLRCQPSRRISNVNASMFLEFLVNSSRKSSILFRSCWATIIRFDGRLATARTIRKVYRMAKARIIDSSWLLASNNQPSSFLKRSWTLCRSSRDQGVTELINTSRPYRSVLYYFN